MFSVLMCVYAGDTPAYLRRAFASIWAEQRLKPAQIVLVVDGPVQPELAEIVEAAQRDLEDVLDVVRLEENQGHGRARQAGIGRCHQEWIVVMDADDVSVPERLELMAAAIDANPDVSVIGSALAEFSDTDGETGPARARRFPETHEEIVAQLPWRSPIAQPTVVLRKSAVLSVGGYKHWHNNEDYFLWVRLAEAGYRFYNIPSVTIRFRTNADTFRRRGGWTYWLSESKLQFYIYKSGVSGGVRPLVVGVLGRFAVQVLLPNSLRERFYSAFLR